MMNFIHKFICGNKNSTLKQKAKSAFSLQKKNIKCVWNCINYNDFGIERIFRLFLVCIQFIFPGLYIREISGKKNILTRKICNELWVIVKILFYIVALYIDGKKYLYWICIYLIAETLCYLLGLIFLSTEYKGTASYKRNLLIAIINYIEITLGFAVVYYYAFRDAIYGLKNSIDAVYFSIISATTIGYGDMYPTTNLAKMICASQAVISFLFTVLIIGIFLSNFNKEGFMNEKSREG